MNNVRCAGLPRGNLWDPPGSAPCGWKGERFAIGYATRHEADTLPIDQLRARVLANTTALRTAKPCPRCGGRVELIAEDQGAGGMW